MAISKRPPVIVNKPGSSYHGQQGQVTGVYCDRWHRGYQPGVVMVDAYDVKMSDGEERTFLTPELDLLAYRAAEQRETQSQTDAQRTIQAPALYLFDVDGTLVSTQQGQPFRKRANDWQLLPGRQERLDALTATGAKVALVTNQGGVAFGYFTEAEMQQELVALQTLIGAEKIYVCYDHPKGSVEAYRAESDCRKPAPGMLLAAIRDFAVEPSAVVMVGDRHEDQQAAAAASVNFIWAHDFFAAQ